MATLERIHLEILRAVETKGSMTAAADTLHLTQSALSHSIKKLEDLIGTDLWSREGRNLRPTQAGRDLIALAHRLLPQLEMAEERLGQYARGERGTLRIGMECHPCYQWLLKVADRYLEEWPSVDLDVRQQFQFGGLAALFSHEIDLLVTPDPLYKPSLRYVSVLDYEQVLVVSQDHRLLGKPWADPEDLSQETLFTYPVSLDRLDVFSSFLTPAGIQPRKHKPIETTEIMLQMVASGRGVAALPRWLVEESSSAFAVRPVRLGPQGVFKQIFVGCREEDYEVDYLRGFLDLAQKPRNPSPDNG